MRKTKSCLQVRSAAIRLRRELQDIGFVTPLEVAHAVLRRRGRESEGDTWDGHDGILCPDFRDSAGLLTDHFVDVQCLA